MIYPEISNLMEKADSRYSLVIAVAKRARDLVDGSVPACKNRNRKQVTIAVNEMAEGKIRLKYPCEKQPKEKKQRMFNNKTVVSSGGGIAAYKAAELVSRLKSLHANVRVCMTKSAQQVVSAAYLSKPVQKSLR